jgi:phosphohistidine phosphatase SixA
LAEAPERGRSDFERALTARGHSQVREIAPKFMQQARPLPVKALTSPLARAHETAEVMAQALAVPLVSIEALSCGTVDATLFDRPELQAAAQCSALLLVGHEPDLAFISSYLLPIENGPVFFGRASIACLERLPAEGAVPQDSTPWPKHGFLLSWYKGAEMLLR